MTISKNIRVHAEVSKAIAAYNMEICLNNDPASDKLTDMVPPAIIEVIYAAIDRGIEAQAEEKVAYNV